MNIAQRLQELLESRGISRSRLAREIGVHTSTVSNWLDGREVKAENLTALCSYFGCTLDYLAGQISGQEKALPPEGERKVEMSPAFFRLKQGLEPYDISESDADFLLEVYKAHIKKNHQE